jgi:Asp-tRNA(Asn)/Glu-tRNA(Gln) amidotransferase C subunit
MELDLASVLKVAESEKVAGNAMSITEMFKETDNLIQQFDKILAFLNRMERSSLVGTIIRQQMKKNNVEVGPLIREDGIIPATESHKQILENINRMNEAQLKEMINALMEYEKAQKSLPDTGANNGQKGK